MKLIAVIRKDCDLFDWIFGQFNESWVLQMAAEVTGAAVIHPRAGAKTWCWDRDMVRWDSKTGSAESFNASG